MSDPRRALTRLLLANINADEEKSARMSRILHDEVGQVLSAVGLQLDVLKLDFRDKVPEINARVDEIQRVLDRAVQEVRTLSYDLNPAVVERAGLPFALERLLGRYSASSAPVIRLLLDPAVRVPPSTAGIWYKIAEHAIDNAVRHSGATKVEVVTRANSKAAVLEVRDNGKGFNVPATVDNGAGLGLVLMQHYAQGSGLRLQIKSSSSRGTLVRVIYPMPAAQEQ